MSGEDGLGRSDTPRPDGCPAQAVEQPSAPVTLKIGGERATLRAGRWRCGHQQIEAELNLLSAEMRGTMLLSDEALGSMLATYLGSRSNQEDPANAAALESW